MKKFITSFLVLALLLTGVAVNGQETNEDVVDDNVVIQDVIEDYISWGDGVSQLSSDPIEVEVRNELDSTTIEVSEYDNTDAQLFTFALETPSEDMVQIQFDQESGEWTEMQVEDGEWVEQDELSDFYTVEYTEGEGYKLELDFGYDTEFKFGIDKKYVDGNQSFYTASEDYRLWFNGENYTSSDNYVEVKTAEMPATEDYELQKGEFLSDLALRGDFTLEELAALNPDIENIDELDEGQIVQVPEDAEIEKYCLPIDEVDEDENGDEDVDEDIDDNGDEYVEEDESNVLLYAVISLIILGGGAVVFGKSRK